MPSVSVAAFEAALLAFADFVGAGPNKRISLLLDCAGWHTSPRLRCPAYLGLYFLPPYSPELQPAEHLWALSDTPLANQCFQNLDQLEEAQAQRCNWRQDHPDPVRSATNFHWWPQCA